MNDMEWSIICTIHQESNYQFFYGEGKTAQAMEQKGLLKFIGDGKYTVTKKGEREYEDYI